MLGFSSNLEKNAIILDIGTKYLKCGVSGERSSRCILKWKVADLMDRKVPLTTAEWLEYLDPVLYKLCYTDLRVSPVNRRFILGEDLLFPRAFREAFVHIVFHSLKAATVALVPSMVLSLYSTSQHTALLIDCGWSETRILPIFKGISLQTMYTTSPHGSKSTCQFLQNSLQHNSTSDSIDHSGMKLIDEDYQDILERACFAQPMKPIQPVAEAQFLTSTKELISVPANIRWEAIEPFFVGSEMTSANSIVTSVLDVVKKSPVDIRAALLGNILLLGGTAMIPGFRERFLDQLKNDLSTDPSYANLSSLIKINGVKFVSTYFPPNMMSWIGGSVYAGTEMSRARVLEAKDFTSVDSNGTGNIPDWMSLLPFEPSSSPVEDKIEPDFY